MNNDAILTLKRKFHCAIRQHEKAVEEFLTCPDEIRGAAMSTTYDQAAELRQILKDALNRGQLS